jgi:2-oxoglutarate dehydrogenase E1 component
LQARINVANDGALDWSAGEALAIATLLLDGYNVRMSGQDVKRGTFSHRHAVLVDQKNEVEYCPLNNLGANAKLEIHNSNLSELAVMGFEYGYSITCPRTLVLWEGQFGDFANGAQMIIDQYIAAAEAKWLRMSGLVLLLPHGYEGQGPEHSSARLERFLQLCAEDNMQVVNCTTPASFFHVLRRQMHRQFRKPLVVMTPKSLLRHKLAVSTLADMASGTEFTPLIMETKAINNKVRKVVLCSGKIYYDLLERRAALEVLDIALLRLEQLYPFPRDDLIAQLQKYPRATVVWCQEEQRNMGAYNFLRPLIEELLNGKELQYVGRAESASPAAGYMKMHLDQQQEIIDKIFN